MEYIEYGRFMEWATQCQPFHFNLQDSIVHQQHVRNSYSDDEIIMPVAHRPYPPDERGVERVYENADTFIQGQDRDYLDDPYGVTVGEYPSENVPLDEIGMNYDGPQGTLRYRIEEDDEPTDNAPEDEPTEEVPEDAAADEEPTDDEPTEEEPTDEEPEEQDDVSE